MADNQIDKDALALPAAHVRPPTPARRRLAVFTYDPSLSTEMDTADVSTTVLPVPWDQDPETGQDTLSTGPAGEYVDVVDYDPASGCFYPPVDLGHPYLLATDGLPPEEGNPQFHQQMVYAVVMATIDNFEQALGRRAIWSPRPIRQEGGKLDWEYVRRLRVYPHALRTANAYYSPQRKALLFGYFPARPRDLASPAPGSMVFTCLSHDVVAHETAHALLDGVHQRFVHATNEDSLAFHEAFADTVGLLQHFTLPEALRHEILRTRGDLEMDNLLSKLGRQFGLATGYGRALRDALLRKNEAGEWIAARPDPSLLERTLEPHARGALLVAALFRAFLSLYKARTEDLLRIASGGRGILPAGAIHPDLAQRLADEAARVARHVLRMSIRALDYCPPVDITFGDYLRALITADYDLVGNDDRGYRVAVIEAFRGYGIYPRDVRTLSEDALLWRGPESNLPPGSYAALGDHLRHLTYGWKPQGSRKAQFDAAHDAREDLHGWLETRFRNDKRLAEGLGLTLDQPAEKFEVHSLRLAERTGPDGRRVDDAIVEVTQRRPLYEDGQACAVPGQWFRGGCTLVVRRDTGELRYCINKHIANENRRQRQREFVSRGVGVGLRATYFSGALEGEPFAMLHRAAEEEEPR